MHREPRRPGEKSRQRGIARVGDGHSALIDDFRGETAVQRSATEPLQDVLTLGSEKPTDLADEQRTIARDGASIPLCIYCTSACGNRPVPARS